MKTSTLKKILSTVLGVMLLVTMIFVISSCTEEHVHSLGEDITMTAATCTTDGVVKQVCTDPECDYYEVRTVKAFGHTTVNHDSKAATCLEEGYKAYVTCENCDYTTFSVDSIIAPKGHSFSAATCTEPATCRVCDETKGDPNGHTPAPVTKENNVPAQCETEGSYDNVVYCSVCLKLGKKVELSRETVVVPALGHNTETHPAKAPTCVYGWDEYETCKRPGCGYTTYHELEPIHAHIPAEKINEVIITTKDPNCTENGSYYMAVLCTICGYECSRGEDKTISALGHAYVNYPGKNATCEEGGWLAYHTCSRCGDTNYQETDATGHDWIDATCTNPSTCRTCGAYSQNPVGHTLVATQINGVAPTCTTAGYYTNVYTCTACNREISRELVDIAPLGHVLEGHSPKAPTCTQVGWTHFETCIRCTYSTYAANEIPANGHTASAPVREWYVAPTCTGEGSFQYATYCTVPGCGAEVSREYVSIAPKGHTSSAVDIDYNTYVPETCTADGGYDEITYCTVYGCGVELTRNHVVIPAHGHTMVTVPAQAPGCETWGHEEYEYCSCNDYGCDCVLTSYVGIAPTGHTDIEVHEAQAPTCTEIGWNVWEECHACGYKNYDVMIIPATGHAPMDAVVENLVEETCTANGSCDMVVYCANAHCELSRVYTVIDNLDGHVPEAAVEENRVKPTCTTVGGVDYVVYCANLGCELSREHEVIPALGHDYSPATGYCVHDGCTDRISVGLAYSFNVDGTLTVAGIGTCDDAEIIIPKVINGCTVTAIGYNAFNQNFNITSVVIPDTVKTIGDRAFYLCKNLKTVTIGSGVTSVGGAAFSMCGSINTVYYNGTAAQWSAISIVSSNEDLTDANRVYLK